MTLDQALLTLIAEQQQIIMEQKQTIQKVMELVEKQGVEIQNLKAEKNGKVTKREPNASKS